jgi:hypothetical protein
MVTMLIDFLTHIKIALITTAYFYRFLFIYLYNTMHSITGLKHKHNRIIEWGYGASATGKTGI